MGKKLNEAISSLERLVQLPGCLDYASTSPKTLLKWLKELRSFRNKEEQKCANSDMRDYCEPDVE